MAGDWIKMEVSTPEKGEVLAITARMGWDDPDLTVGKLFRLWRWFDQQTIDGNARGVTTALLDGLVGVTGFCEALLEVGWLEIGDRCITLPKFDRHNGQTAKSRALTAKRVEKHKRKGNGPVTLAPLPPSLPREEKRREEIKEESATHSSSEKSDSSPRTAKQEKKPQGKKLDFTAEDKQCGEWMFAKVLEVVPGAKAPSVESWANDIRIMRERDQRTHREICEAFSWANQDAFWRTNIMSPAKLRDKWDTIAAKRIAAPTNGATHAHRASRNDRQIDIIAELTGRKAGASDREDARTIEGAARIVGGSPI